MFFILKSSFHHKYLNTSYTTGSRSSPKRQYWNLPCRGGFRNSLTYPFSGVAWFLFAVCRIVSRTHKSRVLPSNLSFFPLHFCSLSSSMPLRMGRVHKRLWFVEFRSHFSLFPHTYLNCVYCILMGNLYGLSGRESY